MGTLPTVDNIIGVGGVVVASMAMVPSILGVDKQLAGFEGAVAVEIKSSTSAIGVLNRSTPIDP